MGRKESGEQRREIQAQEGVSGQLGTKSLIVQTLKTLGLCSRSFFLNTSSLPVISPPHPDRFSFRPLAEGGGAGEEEEDGEEEERCNLRISSS